MKSKISVQHLFCSSCYRSSESSPTKLLPGTTCSTSASGHHSSVLCLWAFVLYLHLFYASVSDMCPKVMVSSLYTILTSEGFIGMLSFWLVEGNQYLYTNPKAKSHCCLTSKKVPLIVGLLPESEHWSTRYAIFVKEGRVNLRKARGDIYSVLLLPGRPPWVTCESAHPPQGSAPAPYPPGCFSDASPSNASMLLPHIAVGGVHSDHGGHLCMPVPCAGAPGRKEAYFPHLSSLRSSQLSLVHGNSQAVLWVREVWGFGMI